MKIIHVIHGYPPFYMAGSEVYTCNLVEELVKQVKVSVFSRVENPFEPAYTFVDEKKNGLEIRRINKPLRDYSLEDKYLDSNIDRLFAQFLEHQNPDIVHVDHLSHLSTNLVQTLREEFDLPILSTLHDFWFFCFKGQLLTPQKLLCPQVCSEYCHQCMKYYFKDIQLSDVQKYRRHMTGILSQIDLFLAPSRFLRDFFVSQGIPHKKVLYSPYGFKKDLVHLKTSSYQRDSTITFGFMGRIIPEKGIHLLLKAFSALNGSKSRLLIFGADGSARQYLEQYANARVIFKGRFDNRDLNDVLSQIDILVVPSIWYENSPLVIQEAFLAGIPVITSNIGGMAELVEDGVTGLTFKMGNVDDLRDKMELIQQDPRILNQLRPSPELVRSIEDDASCILSLYQDLMKR